MARFRFGLTRLLPWLFPEPGDSFAEDEETRVLAREGQLVHQRIQQGWPAWLSNEVRIQSRWKLKGGTVTLGARADGAGVCEDVLHVREIKTTRSVSRLDTVPPQAWRQLLLTAGLLMRQPENNPCSTGWTTARLELHICLVQEGRTQVHVRQFSRLELERSCATHWERIVEFFGALIRHRAMRNRSMEKLAFPKADFRPGQRDMSVAVWRTLRGQGSLLMEAPTGSGKTLAVLYPALCAMAAGHTKQIFFASCKNSGQVAALDALALIRLRTSCTSKTSPEQRDRKQPNELQPLHRSDYTDPASLDPAAGEPRLRILQCQGREKVCRSTCGARAEDCALRAAAEPVLWRALLQALGTEWLDTEAIIRLAKAHEVCPHRLQSLLMPWADVVLADVAYVFAPGTRSDFLFGLNQPALLVDEAHNLPNRAREMFSASIQFRWLDQLALALPSAEMACRQQVRALHQLLALPQTPACNDPRLLRSIEQVCSAAWTILEQPDEPSAAQNPALVTCLQTVVENLSRWTRIAELYGPDFFCERLEEGLDLACLSPARVLQPAYEALSGTVFFSATLSPPAYFQTVLGLPDTCSRHRAKSAWPPNHQLTVVVRDISMRWRDREAALQPICRLLAELWHQRPGNYWVFTPSFSFMRQLTDTFQGYAPEIPWIAQIPAENRPQPSPGDGLSDNGKPHEDFLDAFRQNAAAQLGFVVLGGHFGESIDLVGDRLVGAVILGNGLPPPSARQTALSRYFADQGQDPWLYAQVLPGWLKVVQAAGRVLRSETDRGVVLLVDERFTDAVYSPLFPLHWQVDSRMASEVGQRVGTFWRDDGQSLPGHSA